MDELILRAGSISLRHVDNEQQKGISVNKTLQALSKKLTWHIRDKEQQLLNIEQQLNTLAQQRLEQMKKINEANTIPTQIMPEQEIARLHFIIQQQQQQASLLVQQRTLQDEHQLHATHLRRLKTELKMLEKYQNNKENSSLKKDLLQAQHQADEWSLQQGNHHDDTG